MLIAIILIAIIWIYGDYKKDRNIEKRLQKEKEQALKNCCYVDNKTLTFQKTSNDQKTIR